MKRTKWLCILVAASYFLSPSVFAQALSDIDALKTSPEIIAKVKTGIPQELYVELKAQDILEDERKRRHARNLAFNDQTTMDETKILFDRLKESVFVNGRMQDAYILENDRSVPMVFMQVPNFGSLASILSHPRVAGVYGVKVFRPALP